MRGMTPLPAALRPREDITPTTAIMLNEMIKQPAGKFYCFRLAQDLGMSPATLRRSLVQLEQAGWLTVSTEPTDDPTGGARRRIYRFTADGRKLARAEIKRWTFTD